MIGQVGSASAIRFATPRTLIAGEGPPMRPDEARAWPS
jgi:hypothetical protein